MTNGMVTHAQCARGVNQSSPGPFASLALSKLNLLKRVLTQALVPRFGAAVRCRKSSLTLFALFALRLAQFAAKWGADYPSIVQSWQRNWPRIIPFFDYPTEIRKVICTTNAIESVNMSLRKVTKSRGSFFNDEALIKLYYLALRNISKKWTMPIQNWKAALNRFIIMFDERMPQY